ncbi:chemotaxis protein CheW [Nitrospirillum sp. BR 11752]|uniref:chemotaxis protein CheW n=1 Tax=Nitrospirillum sp. BR 11752 TaxID=3104293 RepID=UPI002EC1DE08|nr:chemotaxis protein CheW [Nitrospirillum sp. BR 11752]
MSTQAGGSARVLTFRVGATRLAVPAGAVTEVLRPPPITRVPHAPASLMGIATVRGSVVPVISLSRLLEGDGGAAPEGGRVLLFDAGEPVALAVNEVGTLADLDTAGPSPDGALYTDGDGAARLIDLKELLRRAFAGLAARTRRGDSGARSVGHQARAAVDERAFLAFALAGQSYALPLAEVAEAITVPDHLAYLPGSDAAMVGTVSHRGRLLPIVSARVLLGLEGGADEGRGARVIVAHGPGGHVGLLVDRLTTILRVPAESVAAVPAVLNRGRGEAQIQSLCRLPDGRGLVSILSAARLFRNETVAHLLAQGRAEDGEEGSSAMDTVNPDAAADRVVVFHVGGEEYGLPVDAVAEVVRLPETLTRVPKAPPFIEGAMTLRGQVLPVIDQRRRFGVAGDAGTRRRVVVTRIDGTLAGFAVDGVSEILTLSADQVCETPDLAHAADGGETIFTRVATLRTADGPERMILLIEPRALLSRTERDLLATLGGPPQGAVDDPGSAPP